MSKLILKQYDDIGVYLSEIEPYLIKYECENTFIRIMIKEGMEKDQGSQQFNTAVWNEDTNELVFAAFYLSSRSSLYGSYLTEDRPEAVKLCLDVFVSTPGLVDSLQWGHAFEPAITLMKDYFNANCEIKLSAVDRVWSHTCSQVNWTKRSLELKGDPLTEFKQATEEMYDVIEAWSAGFLDFYVVNHNARPSPTSNLQIMDNIQSGNIYILWHDKKPVSMAWKRRPMENVCSIGLVYTPDEERGKGYASCCVSMLTEKILEDFKYAHLFIIREQDPEDNLYSRAGYKVMGGSGRMYVEGRVL